MKKEESDAPSSISPFFDLISIRLVDCFFERPFFCKGNRSFAVVTRFTKCRTILRFIFCSHFGQTSEKIWILDVFLLVQSVLFCRLRFQTRKYSRSVWIVLQQRNVIGLSMLADQQRFSGFQTKQILLLFGL